MDIKALDAAKEKLRLAKGKFDLMRAAIDLDKFAEVWSEFLAEQHRVFLRLRKATEHGAGKGWFDKIINQQRDDELLSYLLHARDAAEHGIEPVTQKTNGGIAVKAKPGRSFVHIKHMTVDSGRITMDPETAAQVDVVFIPGAVHLVAVTDRGKVYQPPRRHLGKPLENFDPLAIAELAIFYLEGKIAEAEAKFEK